MEVIITKGEQKRLVLSLYRKGIPLNLNNVLGEVAPLSPAKKINCTINAGGFKKVYTSEMAVGTPQELTSNAGEFSSLLTQDVNTFPNLDNPTLLNNQIAVYIRWGESELMGVGPVQATVEIWYDETIGYPMPDTPTGREIIKLNPARVVEPGSNVIN